MHILCINIYKNLWDIIYIYIQNLHIYVYPHALLYINFTYMLYIFTYISYIFHNTMHCLHRTCIFYIFLYIKLCKNIWKSMIFYIYFLHVKYIYTYISIGKLIYHISIFLHNLYTFSHIFTYFHIFSYIFIYFVYFCYADIYDMIKYMKNMKMA